MLYLCQTEKTNLSCYVLWFLQVKDISTDLRDGIVFIKLMEVLTGRSVVAKYFANPAHRLQQLNNMEIFLQMLKDEGIKLISTSKCQ